MNLLVWLVIGACTGSLAAMTIRQGFGLPASVALGIVGALVGGMVCAHGDLANSPLTVTTFCVSLIGAVTILGFVNVLRTGALR